MADFGTYSPVVEVVSAGTDPDFTPNFGSSIDSQFAVQVRAWVQYDADLTAAEVEDTMDSIDQIIVDTVLSNYSVSGKWRMLQQEGRSIIQEVLKSGQSYLMESRILTGMAHDEDA